MSNKRQKEYDEARQSLLESIKENDKVYTILRRVSRSGMQRMISVLVINEHGVISHLNWSVAKLTGRRLGKVYHEDAVIVKGIGMDMGVDLVMLVSRLLFGREDALRQEWL